MKPPKGMNLRHVWMVIGLAVLGTGAGISEVRMTQTSMIMRRALLAEMRKNRSLVRERESLESQVWALKASPRVSLRATQLLQMRRPGEEQRIVVRP